MCFELQLEFAKFKIQLTPLQKIKIGYKLHIKKNCLYIDCGDFFQPVRRFLRRDSKKKTMDFLLPLIEEYFNFLIRVKDYINAQGSFFTKEYKFAKKVDCFNSSIFNGLYNLKRTYDSCPVIGGLLLYLYDFEDEVMYYNSNRLHSKSF